MGQLQGISAFCACVSLIASLLMLKWLSAAGQHHKHKLMGRQLWHLAVSNLLFVLSSIPIFLLEVPSVVAAMSIEVSSKTMMKSPCTALTFFSAVGGNTMDAVESQLALALVAAFFRCKLALHMLRWFLYFAWPLGTFVGLMQMLVSNPGWATDGFVGCGLKDPDYIGACFGLSCFVFCFICLISMICGMRRNRMGSAAQHRIWARSSFYTVAWLICCLPNIMRSYSATGIGPLNDPMFRVMSQSLMSLRGAASTLVYAVQSNYLRRLALRGRSNQILPLNKRERGPTCQDLGSFQVAIGSHSSASPQEYSSSSVTHPSTIPSAYESDVVDVNKSVLLVSSASSEIASREPDAQPIERQNSCESICGALLDVFEAN